MFVKSHEFFPVLSVSDLTTDLPMKRAQLESHLHKQLSSLARTDICEYEFDKKCLPKNCKPCKISSSKKINTLAGTYTSTEVVTMRNLRLPDEFDKSRNVDSQKALVFQSETCKCDVILGADMLVKTN